jgi:hypothetical protein
MCGVEVACLEEARVPKEGVFDVPSLVVLVVDVSQPEAGRVTIRPLKVIHQRPSKVASDIDSIYDD